MKYYYATKETEEFLCSSSQRVYLYGGYVGYNNFGDIIQLKNAIWFHRKYTGMEPVVVLHLSSLENDDHLKHFRAWYNCEQFIFVSDMLVDASSAGLRLISELRQGGILHIYGGGFLNKRWGDSILEKTEGIIEKFGVSDYFMSGQQIDKQIIQRLNQLFNKKQPLLVGARDMKTYNDLRSDSNASNIHYSFDDVTEVFQAWSKNTRISLKTRIMNYLRRPTTLCHLNMSSYASHDREKIIDILRQFKRRYPTNSLVLAQAYNDVRLSLKDSLQTVVQLENEFPYTEYSVLNIADMALRLQPEADNYPNIKATFSRVNVAIVSSYHTAMLANYFGIPAYLIAVNDYYSQKQKGLGYEVRLDKFFENNTVNLKSFDYEVHERAVWIKLLRNTLEQAEKGSVGKKVFLHKGVSTKGAPTLQYRNEDTV